MMKHLHRLVAVALAAFFIVGSALAQNGGTVTNHAFPIGKGAGVSGYTSLLCGAGTFPIGQAGADPICQSITGDITISAAGVAAIGATVVHSSMLNADVFSTAHGWAGQQTFVAPILGTPASGLATNLTGLPLTTGVTGLLPLANGGCNANLTASNGGIFWSNATQCQILAGTATARLPLLSGASATPVWGAYTLPLSVTSGGIPFFSSTSAQGSSALLVANQIMLGGGAGVAPATMGSLGTTTTVLHGNAAGPPSFAAVTGSDIAANTVANSNMAATMGAFTWKCNNTSGTAAPTDCDTTAFTAKASPAAADIVVIQDSAASNAYKRTTVAALAGAGAVATFNGQTGAVVSYFEPQGRLSLQTLTPIVTTTQSAKTTLFYTPYHGNMVPIYDGTNMVPTAVAEIQVLTTDTTKSPAAIGASKVNDWFIWNDAGTTRVGHGPDWTNDTTRSAGTALVMVNGILLNNASITNGPAASRGTYVGTTRSNGSSQLDYIFGASASGGTAGFFGVWNMYNRVNISTDVVDSGVSYTYSSATTRQARASAGNQVSFVVGLQENAVYASYATRCDTAAVTNARTTFGVGFDSTSAFSGQPSQTITGSAASAIAANSATKAFLPAIGLHFIAAVEASDGTNSNAFNSSSIANLSVMLWN